MKQILVLSTGRWEAERERVEGLSSRMSGYRFTFISPASVRGPFKEARFSRRLKKAVGRSDLILVSPASHTRHLQSLGKPVRPMPYGVDFNAFGGAAELPLPGDLAQIKGPIIGHSGAVGSDSNLMYIEKAAGAHPEWAFVFVGPVCADLTAWKAYPNIHLLGGKPQEQLPAYISRFDICINTAKREDSSPVCLYQYLAAGKPVVSTPHPAQALDYTEAVYLAGTPDEFIACCKKAIGENDAWKARRRVEYGRAAGWDARAAEMEILLKEISDG
jgi:glycosyltransferase involved in cell wall biosynthesis